MPEQETSQYENETGLESRHRRGLDVITLLAGVASLTVATIAFVGTVPEFPGFDLRWLLAGAAVLVGLLLLVGSLRGPRGRGR